MFKRLVDFDVLNDAIEDVDGSAAVQITTAGPSNISTADQVCTVRPEVSAVSVPVNVSVATPVTPPTTTTTVFDDDEDLTIAQTLVKMRSEKAKEKGVAFRDVEETPRLTRSTTTLQPLPTIDPNDKGKGVLVEEEPDPSVKIKRSDQGDLQLQADVELAQLLHQEELAEVERRQRERVAQEEASMAALYEDTINLFRAAQRAVEIRSKPPTKTQLRNMMITYLKNKGKVNHNQTLRKEKGKKRKSSGSLEGRRCSAADYDHKKEELRMWLTVVSDEEETVDPKILSTKYPIVDWESQNLGNVDMEDLYVYKIIRADGNTSYHNSLSSMLRKFDRQDLVDLHRLVRKRFEDNTLEEDEIWSNQQDWTLISWKLYENCGVHTLLMDGTLTCFNMLVEKRYPLIKEMLEKMLNWKLEAKAESTMAFELLKFIKSQLED
ncbi:hypothetical protein Tco_0877979 [Tanacetum coccineum]|uniref:Uncharacterized protein n=1 Tax=Tanacetum coccineum TaxID=301880 RepID=A0ABQ5BZU7_9ASTR